MMCPLRGALSFFLHQAAKLERPAAHLELARPVRTADGEEQVGQTRLEGAVIGERQLEHGARLAAPELLAARPRLRRARRDRQRRRVEDGQRIHLARVVLDGDAHGDVLAQRDLFGIDPHIERERRCLLKRRGCRDRQRDDHADRLRVRARKSAASGAT